MHTPTPAPDRAGFGASGSGTYALRGEQGQLTDVVEVRPRGEDEPAQALTEQVRSVAPELAGARLALRTADGQVSGPMPIVAFLGVLKTRPLGDHDTVSIDGGPWLLLREVEALHRLVPNLARRARRKPQREGPVSQLMLPRLVYQLAANRSTGVLRLSHGSNAKEIFFKSGRPRHIASSQRKELFGHFLVDKQVLTEDQLDLAIQRVRTTGMRLGDALIALDLVQPHELYGLLTRQFREKFLEIFAWTQGWHEFFDGERPEEEVIPLEVDPLPAMTEGVRAHFTMELVEPYFRDLMHAPFQEQCNRQISVLSLRLNARESRFYSYMPSQSTLHALLSRHGRTLDDRLTILRVVFLLHRTDLLSFQR